VLSVGGVKGDVVSAECVQTLYKMWAKSNNPRRVIDDLAYFCRQILGDGAHLCSYSGVGSAPSNWGTAEKWGHSKKNYGALHRNSCPSTFNLLPAPLNQRASKLNGVKNRGWLLHILNTSVKIMRLWTKCRVNFSCQAGLYMDPSPNVYDTYTFDGSHWTVSGDEVCWLKNRNVTRDYCRAVVITV